MIRSETNLFEVFVIVSPKLVQKLRLHFFLCVSLLNKREKKKVTFEMSFILVLTPYHPSVSSCRSCVSRKFVMKTVPGTKINSSFCVISMMIILFPGLNRL